MLADDGCAQDPPCCAALHPSAAAAAAADMDQQEVLGQSLRGMCCRFVGEHLRSFSGGVHHLPGEVLTDVLRCASPWQLEMCWERGSLQEQEHPKVVDTEPLWRDHWRGRFPDSARAASRRLFVRPALWRHLFWDWVLRDCLVDKFAQGEYLLFRRRCEDILGVPYRPRLSEELLSLLGDMACTLVVHGNLAASGILWTAEDYKRVLPNVRTLYLPHLRSGPALPLALQLCDMYAGRLQEVSVLFCQGERPLQELFLTLSRLLPGALPVHLHDIPCEGPASVGGDEDEDEDEDLALLYGSVTKSKEPRALCLRSLQLETCLLASPDVEDALVILLERLASASSLRMLSMNSCAFSDPDCNIVRAVASLLSSLRCLDLSFLHLRTKHLLETDSSLPGWIDLRDNFLWDALTADPSRAEETRSVLSVMLRAHTLLLSGNEMCNVVVVLGELLADPLCAVTRLDLGSNSLTGVNLSYLFECLADNTSIVTLSLDKNHVTHASILRLCDPFLLRNRTLTSLSLGSSGFSLTPGLSGILLQALAQNTVLHTLSLDDNPVTEHSLLELVKAVLGAARQRKDPLEGLRVLSVRHASVECAALLRMLAPLQEMGLAAPRYALDQLHLDGSLFWGQPGQGSGEGDGEQAQHAVWQELCRCRIAEDTIMGGMQQTGALAPR